MPSGPPKTLEAVAGFLLPPACREEVLGDLFERYMGPAQYTFLAMRVVPRVIVSRIRRTAEGPVVLMELLLVYASYIAATWYIDSRLLTGQWGLYRLAIPPALAVIFMRFEDAWATVRERTPMRLTGEVALGSLFAFLCMIGRLPETLNLLGACSSLLLVSAIRIVFRPQIGRQQIAAGPVPEAERAGWSDIAKGLLAGLPVVLIAIALVSIGMRPGLVALSIWLAVVIGVTLIRRGKE